MKTIYFTLIALFVFQTSIFGQTESKPSITWSAYLETYYVYDFNQPANHERPSFLYNHNRHNEFNLNLGFIKGSYSTENTRANLALMAGTYAQYNLAAEPSLLQHVFEANVGVRLSKNNNLWLDAGIMPSHIGFESAISKDCWTLTRSILAENTPYYESGAKVTFINQDNRWTLSGMVLNGWQRIKRPDGNQTLALGTQVQFKPNDKTTLNWSTFIGNDKPSNEKQQRYFSNLYGIFQVSTKLGLIAGFDYGMEQASTGSSDYNTWYSPVAILKYTPNAQWSGAVRWEYYQDKNGVIIATNTPNGFQTSGYSLNVDYKASDNILWRVEGRLLESKDNIFIKEGQTVKDNFSLNTSIAISI
ncbi:porin [Arcicella aquatica]|uniref:Porin n=1 Tax=Arcicella aquatica TaxID=217141 RepID=A0ABU5QRG7_9BACT|nr:porin [Arcicella aquatica]MEA5259692.1 porin [Arcicella aquatica]